MGGNITSAISLHSYGQLWLTPWAYTHDPSPHQDRIQAWGSRAVRAIEDARGVKYKNTRASVGIFRTGGTSQDFYHASGVVFTATIELRDKGSDGFNLPEKQI